MYLMIQNKSGIIARHPGNNQYNSQAFHGRRGVNECHKAQELTSLDERDQTSIHGIVHEGEFGWSFLNGNYDIPITVVCHWDNGTRGRFGFVLQNGHQGYCKQKWGFLSIRFKSDWYKKNFSKKEFYCMGLVSPSHVSVNSRKDEIVELL